MQRERRTLLAIAVASKKVGYVYFVGSSLKDWGVSSKASKNTRAAVSAARIWIAAFEPEYVVTECTMAPTAKHGLTKEIMRAIGQVAGDEPVLSIQIERPWNYDNKYVEAEAFSKRFPQLNPFVPKKPKIWQSEPRKMIVFEALALALSVIDAR